MHLKIQNAAITIAGNTILEEVNFEIKDRDKIAIVCRNCAGKTTLLKAIMDNSLFSEGIGEENFTITSLGKMDIGYLKQITFEDESITLLEEILKSYTDFVNMEKRLNDLVNKMDSNDPHVIQEYTDLQERFKLLGGYSYQKEYEVMINKFGFSEADKSKMLSEFSGGQKTKIAFMKLLLSKPDILLLDEPTNHLDIKTIEWLEEYLKNYPKALIVVSHDRMFLDRIVNIIYDIDYGRTVKYVGNYTFYEREKKKNYERQLRDYEYQQKEIKRLRSIYERFRYKPTKASMALSKLRQIERMELIDKPNKIDTRTFKTNLDKISPSVKNVLHMKDLVIGYSTPLATINLDVIRGKKIGVIGANGIGKSTFLKTINGDILPLNGSLEYGLKVKTGYFDQDLAMLNDNNTVLEEFMSYLPDLLESEARSALGSFLFRGDDVYKHISVLSGGEKVRLQLCKILYNKPNLLLLDEPTNHMDIIGKEHLEDILVEYPGTIIFVSHDRYFVNKIADSLLIFEDGKVEYFPYSYEEYEKKVKENKSLEVKNIEKKESKKNVVKVANNFNDLKRELKIVEKDIIKNETLLKKYNAELAKEENYSDYFKAKMLADNINSLNDVLEVLNKRWEEITDELTKEKGN